MFNRVLIDKLNGYKLIKDSGSVHLNLNEFDHQHPGKDKIESSVLTQYAHESKAQTELIDHLAQYNKITPDNIILTNGGDNSIRLLTDTYLTYNNDTYIFMPTYGQYERFCLLRSANIIKIQLGIKPILEKNRLLRPYHNMLSKSTYEKPSMIFICHPNNPTGSMWSRYELVSLLEKYPKAMFVVDETYIDYRLLTAHYHSTHTSLVKNYKNIAIVRSFSKAFGLAGMRLGYVISHKDNVVAMDKVFNHKDVTEVAKQYGLNIFNNLAFYRCAAAEILESLNELRVFLDKLKIHYLRSTMNFLAIYVGDKKQQFLDAAKTNNLVFRDISNREELDGYIRISIGNKANMTLVHKCIHENQKLFSRTPSIAQLSIDKLMTAENKDLIFSLAKLLDQTGIRYWMDQGTLLGVIRHKGIIPWDDDVDFGIMAEDEKKLESHFPKWEKLGYEFKRNTLNTHWKIYHKDNTTNALVDIFTYELLDEMYLNTDERFRNVDHKSAEANIVIAKGELFPLVKVPFYHIKVNAPNGYLTILDRTLGPNWRVDFRIRTSEKIHYFRNLNTYPA